VPAGAIPKDGPSAGITIATALLSLATGRSVDHTVAMTGEITLRGRVLPIGGVKEKCLAAMRAGIRKVILPEGNRKDAKELPQVARKALTLQFVSSMDEVARVALMDPAKKPPKPAAKKAPTPRSAPAKPGRKGKGRSDRTAGRAARV
jgi:ATP-dependent Lon protease